jgi:hypothetical protein
MPVGRVVTDRRGLRRLHLALREVYVSVCSIIWYVMRLLGRVLSICPMAQTLNTEAMLCSPSRYHQQSPSQMCARE